MSYILPSSFWRKEVLTTYNRYVRMDNGDYARIQVKEPQVPRHSPAPPPRGGKIPTSPASPPKPPEKNQRPMEARAANRVLEHFHLGDIDSGDLLLLSVLFFLFRQDADEELLTALGLLLIL